MIFRRVARQANTTFWNYFMTMPLNDMPDPSEGQMLWQMTTSLVFGAKGLLWFCYTTPEGQGASFNRGGAALSPTGRAGCVDGNCSEGVVQPSVKWVGATHNKVLARCPLDIARVLTANCNWCMPLFLQFKKGPHYEQAGRLNGYVRTLGDFLLHAESTGVWRLHATPPQPADPHSAVRLQPSADVSSQGGCAIGAVVDENDANGPVGQGLRVSHSLAGEGVLLGQFKLVDGRVAVLVQNHNWDWTLDPTLVAAPGYDLSNATEVDGHTGREDKLLDDSPMMAGWQLALLPGMARLIVF